MIITKLKGGLGNQMFQYATGRALAIKNQTELKLDITDTFVRPDRPYWLDTFAIQATIASESEIATLAGQVSGPLAKVTTLLNIGKRPATYIREKSLSFDPITLQLKPPVYLEGYWQSEKYFKPAAELIRQELTVKKAVAGKNKLLLAKIAQTNAVSLHVRRGDYVTNKTANFSHGVCSIEYYQQAARYLAQRLVEPHFYVFSDDTAWVKANLHLDYPMTLIGHNGNAPYEDLRLMRYCQHFIIANSTFSWWGAWLAAHPNKIVVAPKRWFRNIHENPDLVPKEWVRL